jgi:plasmid stabilization system protein ParE
VRVIWAPSALQEIVEICGYIAGNNPAAAGRLADALLTAGDSLESFPHRVRPIGDNLRELVVVYPYIIRYEIDGDGGDDPARPPRGAAPVIAH